MQHSVLVSPAETSALNCDSDEGMRVPFYCEENVWRLCFRRQHFNQTIGGKDWVVFISNPDRCCPMLCQKASPHPSNQPCYWDYHVILLHIPHETQSHKSPVVYDLDSTLPFPCSFVHYMQNSFSSHFASHLQPLFRVVSATTFLQTFYSDRMHMFHTQSQSWTATPPNYACIMKGHAQYDSSLQVDTQTSLLKGSNLHLYYTMQQQQVVLVDELLLLERGLTSDGGIVVDMPGLVALVYNISKR